MLLLHKLNPNKNEATATNQGGTRPINFLQDTKHHPTMYFRTAAHASLRGGIRQTGDSTIFQPSIA